MLDGDKHGGWKKCGVQRKKSGGVRAAVLHRGKWLKWASLRKVAREEMQRGKRQLVKCVWGKSFPGREKSKGLSVRAWSAC